MEIITIKAKFYLGQEVVFFNTTRNKLTNFTVSKISLSITKDETKVYYFDEKQDICKREDECFASREEFIAQL